MCQASFDSTPYIFSASAALFLDEAVVGRGTLSAVLVVPVQADRGPSGLSAPATGNDAVGLQLILFQGVDVQAAATIMLREPTTGRDRVTRGHAAFQVLATPVALALPVEGALGHTIEGEFTIFSNAQPTCVARAAHVSETIPRLLHHGILDIFLDAGRDRGRCRSPAPNQAIVRRCSVAAPLPGPVGAYWWPSSCPVSLPAVVDKRISEQRVDLQWVDVQTAGAVVLSDSATGWYAVANRHAAIEITFAPIVFAEAIFATFRDAESWCQICILTTTNSTSIAGATEIQMPTRARDLAHIVVRFHVAVGHRHHLGALAVGRTSECRLVFGLGLALPVVVAKLLVALCAGLLLRAAQFPAEGQAKEVVVFFDKLFQQLPKTFRQLGILAEHLAGVGGLVPTKLHAGYAGYARREAEHHKEEGGR
mmetsp:Transcript_50803/g.95010  ORF Transcript_50803/g.95010 Transcript_50803/m.95010 type:complete len:423 (-) Transcript_50803:50-1318(-)